MTCTRQMLCKHGMDCPIANGYDITRCTGFKRKEQTNEEWLRNASTEELAEWLADHSRNLASDCFNLHEPWHKDLNVLGDKVTKKDAWVEWLQEEHN